jgi:hypothetical protein
MVAKLAVSGFFAELPLSDNNSPPSKQFAALAE